MEPVGRHSIDYAPGHAGIRLAPCRQRTGPNLKGGEIEGQSGGHRRTHRAPGDLDQLQS